MAASVVENPATRPESKSAKKKKNKVETPQVETPPAAAAVAEHPSEAQGEGGSESPYIRELHKNIRNITKKITNASKVDNIIAENPTLSLDDLVATRKINNDQKAQIEKRPALQAQLAQLQEQIIQYKKFEADLKASADAERAEFEKAFTERTQSDVEERIAAAKAETLAKAVQNQRDALLIISQFLRLAAIRRGDDEADAELDENKALEGVLSGVYHGNLHAVETMMNLVEGSEKTAVSISNEPLKTTFSQIKAATIAAAPPLTAEETSPDRGEASATQTQEHLIQSDPTIANAGLTELDEPLTTNISSAGIESHEVQGVPQNSSFGEGGNAAAEANWDNANDLSASQEWVEVPRDAAETDTGLSATPAAPSNVQSWADDTPEVTAQPAHTATPNDGFHEVQRSRGSNRGDGHRGRGRGGDNRGRGGFRGDYRGGRGRGGPRGGPRGGRPNNESS